MKSRSIPESTIRRLIGKTCSTCCLSCHAEMEYGYSGIEVDLGKGRWAEVCCAVSIELEKRFQNEPQHLNQN